MDVRTMNKSIIKDTEYATDKRKARRKKTQEFFTPSSLVVSMCDKIDEAIWKDPSKDFLEPSFGNGNFIMEILKRKLKYTDWKTALEHIWGVELMEDNVEECKERILAYLDLDDEDAIKARAILDEHLVCSDFFEWDYENWKHK